MLIKAYTPPSSTDKEIRVDGQSIHFENHRVFLRRPASWLREYVAELTGFPLRPKRCRCISLMIWRSRSFCICSASSIAFSVSGSSGSASLGMAELCDDLRGS